MAPIGHKSGPKVTIAIPTWNRAEKVVKAIDSALNQAYNNIEVIVSDNASTDNTINLLDAYSDDRLIVLKQSVNCGMANNWNECLNRSSGDYFILLSDDDY